jgi:hypothetical protein
MMSTAFTRAVRVPVPEDLRRALLSLAYRIGKCRAYRALKCSQFTFEDAIALGSRMRPEIIAKLRANLPPVVMPPPSWMPPTTPGEKST